jgi:hypothetical protein
MFYAGDEYADDEETSGPIPDDDSARQDWLFNLHRGIDAADAADIDTERQAAQDEYDEMYPQGESQ